MKKPAVKLETIDVTGVNLKSAKLMFGIQVDNPNDFALKVDSVKYDIELGGKHMTTESIDTPTEVGANAKTIVQLPLTIQIADIFNSIGDFLKNDATAYRVKGAARVGLFSLPFDESGEFKIIGNEVKHFKK
jgi:LEA14-like dessication related protein